MQGKDHQVQTGEAQIISLSETQSYISLVKADPPDPYWQHLLRGWMKFVAPLTPPSIQDGVDPSQHNLESAYALLQTVERACAVQLCENSFSLMVEAWPTMWIWIQHLYNAHHSHLRKKSHHKMEATEKDFISRRYLFIVNMFVNLGNQSHPLVSEMLANDPGILSMMTDMWIWEGTADDSEVVNGFPCGSFVAAGHAMEHAVLAQVISTCGTAEMVVHVACQRLERIIREVPRNFKYNELSLGVGFFTGHMNPKRASSPLVSAIYASSELASTLMRAWGIISSSSLASFEHSSSSRDLLLELTMSAVFLLVRSHDRILDVLRQDFFPILVKSFSIIQSSPKYSSHIGMSLADAALRKAFSPAAVHREILSLMFQGMGAIHGNRGNFLPSKYPRVVEAWSGLMILLHERKRVYDKFKKNNQTVILCGNATVNCVDLSYPNLNFLSYLVIHDMSAHFCTHHVTWPLLFLQYDQLKGSTPSVNGMGKDRREEAFPFANDNALYEEWWQLLVAGRGAYPILVAIPQGAIDAVQLMTGIVQNLSSDSGRPVQEQTELMGIRWLHCHLEL
ncbi:hypothetical protein FIBSPDRAFT_927887 [Athelia psychrophila]|uniref:Uncharacterized protein n=1 Tax=Athelia psychrophila TaxID=1759441 RepID=A0A166R598_9AGAM|nr:hypothetical protein FIBSPDRAFT_927887 [Fibularhizoctonia sp. CBS 109695]